MYKVNILNQGLIPPFGEGPIMNQWITEEMYCRLMLQKYNVVRDYEPTDLKILKGRGKTLLEEGKTLQLNGIYLSLDAKPNDIQWSSSDEKVVTVDQNGLVKATDKLDKAVAFAFIKAAIGTDKTVTDQLLVEVRQPKFMLKPVLSVEPEEDGEIRVLPNARFSVTAKITPSLNDGAPAEYNKQDEMAAYVSNPSIVQAIKNTDTDGMFQFLSKGLLGSSKVRIYSTNFPEVFHDFTISVVHDLSKKEYTDTPEVLPSSITIEPAVINVTKNNAVTFAVNVLPKNATHRQYHVSLLPNNEGQLIGSITNNRFLGLNAGSSNAIISTNARDANGKPLATVTLPITVFDSIELQKHNDNSQFPPADNASANGDGNKGSDAAQPDVHPAPSDQTSQASSASSSASQASSSAAESQASQASSSVSQESQASSASSSASQASQASQASMAQPSSSEATSPVSSDDKSSNTAAQGANSENSSATPATDPSK